MAKPRVDPDMAHSQLNNHSMYDPIEVGSNHTLMPNKVRRDSTFPDRSGQRQQRGTPRQVRP